jgi:hypothetical protein
LEGTANSLTLLFPKLEKKNKSIARRSHLNFHPIENLKSHVKVDFFIDFRVSWWLIIYVNSVLGLLCRVIVGDIAYVSKVHSVSIFRLTLQA